MWRQTTITVLALGVVLWAWAQAAASPIIIGSGVNMSMVLIEFTDGNLFEFAVSYDGSATGEDLLYLMRDEIEFDVQGQLFDFGAGLKLFVFGMSFEGSGEGELGKFATSPTYYIRSAGDSPWQLAPMGATDRTVSDGSIDGWSFSEVQIPEPVVAGWLLFGAVLLLPRGWRCR